MERRSIKRAIMNFYVCRSYSILTFACSISLNERRTSWLPPRLLEKQHYCNMRISRPWRCNLIDSGHLVPTRRRTNTSTDILFHKLLETPNHAPYRTDVSSSSCHRKINNAHTKFGSHNVARLDLLPEHVDKAYMQRCTDIFL